MVTEVFTVKYCDPHASREEKVEATEVIQFAHEGTLREVDSCADCFKEFTAWIEPLVDYSRPVKRTRKTKNTTAASTADAAEAQDTEEDSGDA